MRRLLLASAALLALTGAANADIIASLGVNPTSGQPLKGGGILP